MKLYLSLLASKMPLNVLTIQEIRKAERAISVYFDKDIEKITPKEMNLWGGEMIKRIIQSYGKHNGAASRQKSVGKSWKR